MTKQGWEDEFYQKFLHPDLPATVLSSDPCFKSGTNGVKTFISNLLSKQRQKDKEAVIAKVYKLFLDESTGLTEEDAELFSQIETALESVYKEDEESND